MSLTPELADTIVRRFPGFHQIGDYSPGDFDGNKLEDVALYLTNRRPGLPLRQGTWLLVAFHQATPGTFQPYLIERRRDPSTQREPGTHRHSRFGDYYLGDIGAGSGFPVEAGRHHTRQMELRHDAFFESHYGGFKVWFFEGGRYRWVWEVGGFGD